MKKTNRNSILSFILSIILIAAIVLSFAGCKDTIKGATTSNTTVITKATNSTTTLGNGKTQFSFFVVDHDGKQTNFIVKTNQTFVGDALQEVNLIQGEDSQYGLYVKSVNGIILDYEKDGMYWAFYENDNYAQTGVDKTKIDSSVTYSFKAEK